MRFNLLIALQRPSHETNPLQRRHEPGRLDRPPEGESDWILMDPRHRLRGLDGPIRYRSDGPPDLRDRSSPGRRRRHAGDEGHRRVFCVPGYEHWSDDPGGRLMI